MNDLLHVKILTPNKILFDSQAKSVSSKNALGPFDVLAQHANFITFIQNQPITIVLPDNKKVQFNFPMAILYNNNSQVKIYTDILARPDISLK